MPGSNGQSETFGAAISEVSERVSLLVREEIELAKAEVTAKAMSLLKGAVAAAVGAVFGVFALVFGLLSLAWGLNSILSSIWLGFIITFGVLLLMGGAALMFALRKLRVGAPAPTMAIDEAKRIRATVSSTTGDTSAGQSAITAPGTGAGPSPTPATTVEERR